MNKPDLTGEKRPNPVLVFFIIVFLIGGLITQVILIGNRQPDSSTRAGSIEYEIATQEIGSGENIVIGINDTTIYIAREAVTVAGSIVIFSQTPNLFSAGDALSWSRPLVVNVEYRNVSGVPYRSINFSIPVEVCFKLTRARWEDYADNPEHYQVQYYTEEENPPYWDALPLVSYSERSELCGLTDHLSLFALAIKPEEIIPITGGTPGQPQGVYEP